ncbi:MAG TPA: 3-isopropylmalate dehydratase small subunit [Trueperaceae bacterium]
MALDPITTVAGRGVHVPGDDIDTDRIIPARYLKCVTFDDLGEHLFKDVRFDEEGRPKGHPLDDPRFAGASILLSGNNFGCGSSREHAPQSLYRHGIRAIIAESFAEIFFGNCTTLGLPCVEAQRADIRRLAEAIQAKPDLEITVDVEAREVRADGLAFAVRIPESARSALVEGRWDPIADLLEGRGAVAETAQRLAYLEGGR